MIKYFHPVIYVVLSIKEIKRIRFLEICSLTLPAYPHCYSRRIRFYKSWPLKIQVEKCWENVAAVVRSIVSQKDMVSH